MARLLPASRVLGVAILFCAATVARAVPPSDSLLPATTKGYASIPNLAQLVDQFNRSQFGQLANDPAMKPFVDDFKRQIGQQGMKQLEQLELPWEELDGVPGGEVAVATIQTSADDSATALVVDVTGHTAQAEALLTKISGRMSQNGAKKMARKAGDSIVAYQLTGEPGRKSPPVAAYFLSNNLLVASDNIAVIEEIQQALAGGRKDSLASLPAYHAIMAQCETAAGGLAPNLRWFVEPFGYAETVRAAAPLREKRKGPDLIKVFKNQGFTAVQGVGGFVNFSAGKYELLHRTMVYAPPAAGHTAQDKDKYTLAARMLRFPAGGDLLPPAWVPQNVATCTSLNCDIQNGFANIDSLVDEMVGEKGVFHDVLASLRDDPDGPRVDIEKNLVAYLSNHITIISDCELPIGPKSERKVVAIEVTNEPVVADTIRKMMESEKDARRREFDGHVIWELVDCHCDVPTLEVETPGLPTRTVDSNSANHPCDCNNRLFSTSAVCVANGNLFLASHMDLLKQVLAQPKQAQPLAKTDDYRLVAAQAQALGVGPLSFRIFSRVDQEFLPTYELVRTGQMPQSETVLAKLLNSALGDGKDGPPRKQRIDGHDLPDFSVVQRHLGPGGTFVTSLDDGWMCTGLMMQRDASDHGAVAAEPSKKEAR